MRAARIWTAAYQNPLGPFSGYGISMPGSVLATVPALFIFIVLQRYFVQGIALTGLKG